MTDSGYQVSDPSNLPGLSSIGAEKDRTEELRQELRSRGLRDLYFLCKVILGYVDLVPHVHLPMCEFSRQVSHYRQLRLMPRSHFKTTIWTIAETIQDILRNPNERILLIADTSTNAERFMSEIQQHFELNEVFRWVYRESVPDNFNKAWWNKSEMCVDNRTVVSREPTIDAIGAMAGVESRHYTKIKADDLVTEKFIHSDTEMDKLIRWIGGIESLLTEISRPIVWVGSRKKKGDLYDHILKTFGTDSEGEDAESEDIGPYAVQTGDLAVFSRDARDENRDPIFPEKVTRRFLDRLQKFDPERYYAQYANSPKGTGLNTFDIAWVRHYTMLPNDEIICRHEGEIMARLDPWTMDRVVLFDPAKAEKKSSSQQAILLVAKGSGPYRIILDSKIGHYPPDEAINYLFELERKWRPTAYSIEHRGYQGSIKYWLEEKAETEGLPHLPVIEWPFEGDTRAQWAKTEWIKGLQPLFRAGYIWLDPSMKELLEQIEFYPNVKWDDGLDALSQGLSWWPISTDEMAMKKRDEAEKDYLRESGILLLQDFEQSREEQESWNEEEFLRRLGPSGYGTTTFIQA